MTVKRIVQAKKSGGSDEDEAILTTATRSVTIDDSTRTVVADLLDTMASQPLCVGLAATQIGLPLRIAVAKLSEDENLVLINPRLLSTSGKKDVKRESCMSLWGWTGSVERREKVTLEFEDLNGNIQTRSLKGFAARIVLHEVDHLDGHLYSDHVAGGLQPTDLFDDHSPEPASET